MNFARPRAMWVCARSALPEFNWDEGERRTQRALELDPNDPEANRIMGSILMHRGAFDASRKYHEKAMELSPSDAYVKGRSAAFYNFTKAYPRVPRRCSTRPESLTHFCMSGASRSASLCLTTSVDFAKRSRRRSD